MNSESLQSTKAILRIHLKGWVCSSVVKCLLGCVRPWEDPQNHKIMSDIIVLAINNLKIKLIKQPYSQWNDDE